MKYSPSSGLKPQGEFLLELQSRVEDFEISVTNKRVRYYNVPAAFDIETSSFYENGVIEPQNKRAIMYIWQFGIDNLVTYGRTWDELKTFLNILSSILGLDENNRLVVYVHNLPYEWQFIRNHFEWNEVFILDDRKPVSARFSGLEFKCSLKLAGGKSLANVGKDLVKYPVEKMVGDLDYSLIRTPLTPLTDSELKYCENDIRVLLHYIQEKIEQDGDITRIPLTNTGYVRNYCRKACFRNSVSEVQECDGCAYNRFFGV